jgi:DNA-binding LacI/PurR family transcriptional regulator
VNEVAGDSNAPAVSGQTRPIPVSIVDVARIAGVSRQTVSNVLNERPGFSKETRLRVLQAIEESGYKPNRAARQLRAQRTWHVGLPLRAGAVDVRNPFALLFLRAVADAVASPEQSLIVFSCPPDGEQAFRTWVRSGEVDGCVLSHITADDYRTRILTELSMPFVVVGRTAEDQPQTWVDIDNRGAMAGLVDYLVGRGRRRFAYVDHGGGQHWAEARIEGAGRRLAEHGIALPPTSIVRGEFDALATPIDQLLRQPEPPDTLICGSDALALVAADRVRRAGLEVGGEVAVTGFDGGLHGWLVDQTLTTVRIPVERIAETMVRMLMSLLAGEHAVEGTVMPTELVIGSSA